METSDNRYVEDMIKSWEVEKSNIRKKLPEIYETSNEDIKKIISMLVEAEYELAIRQDNEIRRNGSTRDVNASNYKKENAKIMEMIEAL